MSQFAQARMTVAALAAAALTACSPKESNHNDQPPPPGPDCPNQEYPDTPTLDDKIFQMANDQTWDDLRLPAPTAGSGKLQILHTIRAGDTLFSIGRHYGVQWRSILKANQVNPQQLKIGEVLEIPLANHTDLPNEELTGAVSPVWIIKRGDTLEKIAKQYYGDAVVWPQILTANPDCSPSKLRIGQEIVLPKIKSAVDIVQDLRMAGKLTPTGQLTPTSDAPPHVREFIRSCGPLACQLEEKTGIPAKIVLLQAALESGWGQHAPGNNYLGLKDHSQTGSKFSTLDYINGQAIRHTTAFQSFDSLEDCLSAYGQQLTKNYRYIEAFKSLPSSEDFLRGLQTAGYSTDPDYTERVLKLARHLRD